VNLEERIAYLEALADQLERTADELAANLTEAVESYRARGKAPPESLRDTVPMYERTRAALLHTRSRLYSLLLATDSAHTASVATALRSLFSSSSLGGCPVPGGASCSPGPSAGLPNALPDALGASATFGTSGGSPSAPVPSRVSEAGTPDGYTGTPQAPAEALPVGTEAPRGEVAGSSDRDAGAQDAPRPATHPLFRLQHGAGDCNICNAFAAHVRPELLEVA
jgi:hypothetical protein